MQKCHRHMQGVGQLRLDTDWCCSDNDCNGFWFNEHHPEEDWLEAWRKVVKMSRPYKAVVGAGLKNEIRAMMTGKSWGSGAFCSADIFDKGNLEFCSMLFIFLNAAVGLICADSSQFSWCGKRGPSRCES